MDTSKIPYKVEFQVATFEGDWTAEQIDNGEAPEPTIDKHVEYYEPTPHGPKKVTDPSRIAELEERINSQK